MTGELLAAVLAGAVEEFALICRTGPHGRAVEVVTGEVGTPASLNAVPIDPRRRQGSDVLVVVPYRQLAERGHPAPDDGTPLLAMTVTDEEHHPVPDVLAQLPTRTVGLTGGHFEPDDDAYAELVRAVLDNEIGTGQGANFVIKRSYLADVSGYDRDVVLSVYRELLAAERGAYWTFLLCTNGVTLIGASPERHIGLSGGEVAMNPISGTYRYPADGPTLRGVTDFLADRKETEELYMVVDEELKMMCRICAPGSTRVTGPFLKEMTRLAHTEYHITGRTIRDVREVLRETMFAPTVTGSPVESAARVIQRYEPGGRGYYSGVIGLIGTDDAGEPSLDSAILIRTAAIDPHGRLTLSVGSTLVRHSDPGSEVAETKAKAAGLLAAFSAGASGSLAGHPEVLDALRRRNDGVAEFWTATERRAPEPTVLVGRKALVIDAEDTFTSMLDHQLCSLGLTVMVRRFDETYQVADHDLVVVGPGPGNPCEQDHPKIASLHRVVTDLLDRRRPFVAVCLSHQVLCRALGLPVLRRDRPNQGVQRGIDLFGRAERVGYYNSFEARSEVSELDTRWGPVSVSRDPATGEVHALRGNGFASLQFHAESLLTIDGPRILTDAAEWALGS